MRYAKMFCFEAKQLYKTNVYKNGDVDPILKLLHSKLDTLIQSWFIVGKLSVTLAQHKPVKPMSRVCWIVYSVNEHKHMSRSTSNQWHQIDVNPQTLVIW